MKKSGWLMVAAGALWGVLAVGCGGSSSGHKDGGSGQDSTPISTEAWGYPQNQYVVDQILLPQTKADVAKYGFDLDGNGTIDNQIGNLIEAVAFLHQFQRPRKSRA